MRFRKIYIVGAVVLFLILMNPSSADFATYLFSTGRRYDRAGRMGYFLIFSIYKSGFEGSQNTYIGFFKNFIKIKEEL